MDIGAFFIPHLSESTTAFGGMTRHTTCRLVHETSRRVNHIKGCKR